MQLEIGSEIKVYGEHAKVTEITMKGVSRSGTHPWVKKVKYDLNAGGDGEGEAVQYRDGSWEIGGDMSHLAIDVKWDK